MTSEPEHLTIAEGIPALIWRASGPGARPALITIHGGGGSKRDVGPRAVELATGRGVTVVAIDAYLHGEHVPPHFDRRVLARSDLALLLEIYEHTAQDLFQVVSFLDEDSAVDAGRLGLRGGSMGGYIVLAVLGMGVPVHAGLSVCGAADYVSTFRYRLQHRAQPEADIEQKIRDVQGRIEQIDPLFHPDRFPPRPIMMIHGARDPLVPIAGQRALYDRLLPYYRDEPQNCLFLTHAGGHETPWPIEEMGWNWLLQQISV